jgi:hypothetical protein
MLGRRASKKDSLFTPLLGDTGDTGKKKLPSFSLGKKGVKYAVTALPLKIKDIKEIAKKWKNEPLKDPYNNKDVPLSIHPKSEYVLLYKKIIDGLIKDLVKDFESIHPHLDYVLTIYDCINIRNALPDMHSIITISETEKIKYDHLFIKYFINKTRKYKYDVNYCKDSEINLYLNVYNAIKRKNPTVKRTNLLVAKLKEYKNKALSRLPFKKTAVNQSSKSQSFAKDNYVLIEDLLQNNIDLDKTDISISKILLRLSIDIRTISYMHESKFTDDNYKIVLSNKKILEYVASLYKADFIAGLISEDIKKHLQKKIIFNTPRDGREIYFIYEDIQIFSKDDNNEVILNRFINIYNTIEILYKNYFASKINKGSSNRRSNGKSSSGYEYLEIQMIPQYIYEDISKGIIGLYSFHITIKLGDMGFPIINSTPDGDKKYNNNPELNSENSLILKLPMFNEQKYKNANTYVIQLMKEIQDEIKIDKFLKKKTFPYRINNEENERWNIIVDLPPFDFDIDEDSDIVFERFKKYVKKYYKPLIN